MNISISIDKKTCIKCRKCVRICPANILIQETLQSDITLQNVETCIKCGHCVGVCPTFSVIHSVFPAVKVHPINIEELPSPEQIMLLIKSRRSNRAFSKKPVPDEILDLILEAAHRAPTASNMQQVDYTLVTNPEILEAVIETTMDIFIKQAKKMENSFLRLFRLITPDALKVLKQVKRMQEARDKGLDPILRDATALILIHTPKRSRFGYADANLAYQNGSLMAESLKVNQFYTGFLCTALKMDKKRSLYDLLKIKGTVHAGMALGMPAFKFENYIDKKEIRVTKL